MSRYLDATNDVAFKKVFSNKEILEDLLNSILRLPEGKKIEELHFVPQEEVPDLGQGKRSIFDIKVRDQSGFWYIVEMQNRPDELFLKRVQVYAASAYSNQLLKGENYKGLPYRILDYPRLFKQDGIFAYRIMFWWGRGFYFTFHLSGKYLKPYLPKVETQFSKWQHQNVFYYHHHEEWEHEIAAPFYHPIENIHFKDLQQIGEQQGFVKFARQLEVLQIEKVKEVGLESFKLFLS